MTSGFQPVSLFEFYLWRKQPLYFYQRQDRQKVRSIPEYHQEEKKDQPKIHSKSIFCMSIRPSDGQKEIKLFAQVSWG